MNHHYESPLSNRYGSKRMQYLFSKQMRFQTWRMLWVELARAQKELGVDIKDEQIEDLQDHVAAIDFSRIAEIEKTCYHDVIAHIRAYGEVAPSAAGIIHLGATSCFVTDNTDLILYRKALNEIREVLISVIKEIAEFAEKTKALPTVGYTHYQPAQLVTVGKRAALWLQDLNSDVQEIDFVLKEIKFLGCRGATGTEASLLELFNGDSSKVDELNQKLCHAFGFQECFSVTGQTYPRKLDSRIQNSLSSIAQSCYKLATDIRLLQHDNQLEELFTAQQVGSSAMPYKRNPMRCARICSLARYVMVNSQNAVMTASNQWLERTLDDSANRHIAMPEAFLCIDTILLLIKEVINNLYINEAIIEQEVNRWLPFIATEKLLIEGVRRGGNRQELHEIIRVISMNVRNRMREGYSCNLLQELGNNPLFPMVESELKDLLLPQEFIGRSVEQVENYLKELEPILLEELIRVANPEFNA